MSGPVVYTAQSKQYFYCRDAICEFVFQKGGVPLNPFRAFDYFLSDRVPRDAVRDANHALLSLSDEVWVFGETLADGVLIEIAQAEHAKMPIRYFSVDNRADCIRELAPNRLDFEREVYSTSGMGRQEILKYLLNGSTEFVATALGRRAEVPGAV
ncbi:DUF7768 domain-containing protein [Kribbella pratensis]|uniref:DUF7768 domain-containing protein n=1 Tax=Kribbella pratensis TaxID=2512112 RepID=UPI001064F872|nr:hypothetical protein [Kribbella pratensis]